MTLPARGTTSGLGPEANAKERGLALIVVLWVVASAALLVAAFNATVRSGASFVTSEIEATKAQALFDAGLEIAAAHLIDEPEERRWQPDGRAYQLALGGAALTIAIDDANGFLDLNKTGEDVLRSFFERVVGRTDQAKRIVDKIIQLRNGQQGEKPPAAKRLPETLMQSSRATAPASGKQQPSSETGMPSLNGQPELPFRDVTELRRMSGMTPEIYARIAPYLTVYGRDGRINPYSASRALLAALPKMNEVSLDRFFAFERKDPVHPEGVPQSLSAVGASLSQDPGSAYIVTVTVAVPGRPGNSGKQFVILTGLDDEAPYRLVTVRSLSDSAASGT